MVRCQLYKQVVESNLPRKAGASWTGQVWEEMGFFEKNMEVSWVGSSSLPRARETRDQGRHKDKKAYGGCRFSLIQDLLPQ